MKLRNKKTEDIAEVLTDSIAVNVLIDQHDMTAYYTSLAELNKEWEDYEEPNDYWFIDCDGSVYQNCQNSTQTHTNHHKLIGNYFETKEEAEKAVEKLEAVKRLKDNGFRFKAYQLAELNIKFFLDHGYTEMGDDLDLLFGGEDE